MAEPRRNQPPARPLPEAPTAVADHPRFVSWNDPRLPAAAWELGYSTSADASHPWLSGSPYQLNSGQALMRISALNRGRRGAELPANLFISTAYSKPLSSVVNIWPTADRPQFYRYKPATSFQHNSFVQSGGRLQISPACAGYLLDGAQLSSPAPDKNLAVFNRMVFDDYDWEAWLDSGLDVHPAPFCGLARKTLSATPTGSLPINTPSVRWQGVTASRLWVIPRSIPNSSP